MCWNHYARTTMGVLAGSHSLSSVKLLREHNDFPAHLSVSDVLHLYRDLVRDSVVWLSASRSLHWRCSCLLMRSNRAITRSVSKCLSRLQLTHHTEVCASAEQTHHIREH